MHLRPTQFDGGADAPVRCHLHRPMEGVHGYPGSHWKPQLGKYSHRIAPADDRVCMQTKNDEKASYLPAVLLAVAVRRYDTKRIARWRATRATLEATGCRHRASIAADRMNRSRKSQFFPVFSSSTR